MSSDPARMAHGTPLQGIRALAGLPPARWQMLTEVSVHPGGGQPLVGLQRLAAYSCSDGRDVCGSSLPPRPSPSSRRSKALGLGRDPRGLPTGAAVPGDEPGLRSARRLTTPLQGRPLSPAAGPYKYGPSAPLVGFRVPSTNCSSESPVHPRIPLLGTFRPQGFAPSRRLTPLRALRACFIPLPPMG